MPYVFVPSRAELGAAGNTKRPTSVVLVGRESGGKKKKRKGVKGEKGENGEGKEDDEEEEAEVGKEEDFEEVYRELVKVVLKASRDVRI